MPWRGGSTLSLTKRRKSKLSKLMRKNNSTIIWSLKIFMLFMIFLILNICLHEYAHIQTLRLLGGDGYVKYTLLSGHTIVTAFPKYEHWRIFTALSGGGIIVIIYFILDHIIVETDVSIALRLMIGHQLPYTIMEGLGLNLLQITNVAVALGMILVAIWSIPLFKKTFYP